MKKEDNKNNTNYKPITGSTAHFTLTSSNSRPINVSKMTGNSQNSNENKNKK